MSFGDLIEMFWGCSRKFLVGFRHQQYQLYLLRCIIAILLSDDKPAFKITLVHLSETSDNLLGQVECPFAVIPQTSENVQYIFNPCIFPKGCPKLKAINFDNSTMTRSLVSLHVFVLLPDEWRYLSVVARWQN